MLFSFILAFVRSDFDEVRKFLKPYFEPLGEKPPAGLESVIFRFENSEWTGFLYDQRCIASLDELSSKQGTECVVLQHDDRSSWANYQQLQSGKVVEEYECGPVDEEYSNTTIAGWQIITSDDYGEEIRFPSTHRTLREDELRPADKFFDRTFRLLNLWCPDWGTISKLPDVPTVRAEARTIYW